MNSFDLNWLSDPEIFSVGELEPFSDHRIFASQEEAAAEKSSLVRSLNGTWKAHFAQTPAEAPEGLLTGDTLDETLEYIRIPCEFQLIRPDWDAPRYVNVQYPWDGNEAIVPPAIPEKRNPTVTVVRRFELTAAEAAMQTVLTFEGVEAALALYINGQFVGYAEDSFVPHHFDISSFVCAGENRIAARIFRHCTGNWLEDQDFWRFSGIHRSVTLTFRPATHLRDLFLRTPLEGNYTRAFLEADLSVDRPCGNIGLKLLSPDGIVAAEMTVPAKETVHLRREIINAQLWSAECPCLYDLWITLTDEDDTVLEVIRQEVGFRQFEKIDKLMCLNGKRIVFHGVNRHEFDCDRGRVMTDELLLKDLHDMKGMNINAVRTCHYPNDSRFYRLCDRYGLYVIDETNIESHGSWSPYHDWVVPGDRPEWHAMTLHRGQCMQERDKNHPSILFWSCGNESFGGTNLRDLADMFRHRDPTRLVHYEGVVNDPRYPETTDVYSRMYAKVADIEQYMANDPEKPFINCEFTHAMGNSCGGMSLYTELEDKYPLYQGGFIWDYVDQALRITLPNGDIRLAYGGDFGDRPTDWQFNTNGLILGDRTFTGKVQEVRYLYQNARLIPDRTGVRVENRQIFAPLTGLRIEWSLLEDCEEISGGSVFCPDVPAGESVHVTLPVSVAESSPKETVLTCYLTVDREDQLLEKGFRIAQGQTVWNRKQTYEEPAGAPVQPVTGDYNIGFHTDRLSAQIGYREGGLTSFRDLAGKQALLRAPQLSLFRAWTDNDHGNKYQLAQGFWHLLSRYAYVTRPEIEQSDGCTRVSFTYTTPLNEDVKLRVSYRPVVQDGLEVTLEWPGVEGLPDPAAMGLSFQLDPRLKHVRYFGLGPDENYIDRCEGALLGWHAYESQDGMTRYEKPQESGNRMGVQKMTVTDDDGHGIEITGHDLEISVQPCLPEELACAWHYDELKRDNRTVLDIAAFRRGIGGDDSWDAPVLPQFTYPADRNYVLKFCIRAI